MNYSYSDSNRITISNEYENTNKSAVVTQCEKNQFYINIDIDERKQFRLKEAQRMREYRKRKKESTLHNSTQNLRTIGNIITESHSDLLQNPINNVNKKDFTSPSPMSDITDADKQKQFRLRKAQRAREYRKRRKELTLNNSTLHPQVISATNLENFYDPLRMPIKKVNNENTATTITKLPSRFFDSITDSDKQKQFRLKEALRLREYRKRKKEQRFITETSVLQSGTKG